MIVGKAKAKKVWLTYFNQVLFEKSLISEEEFRRMNVKIEHGQ